MPFYIVRNDITLMETDAIVNSANPRPAIGSGTDTGIHAAAGPQLLEARKAIGPIGRGGAAVTPGYALRAKWVIHTVAPRWKGGEEGEEQTLRSCYRSALELAVRQNCESVSFPLLAAGSYGYP